MNDKYEPVIRVARAIGEELGYPQGGNSIDGTFVWAACRVIAALRAPTKAMIEAAERDAQMRDCFIDPEHFWGVMIDAALREFPDWEAHAGHWTSKTS